MLLIPFSFLFFFLVCIYNALARGAKYCCRRVSLSARVSVHLKFNNISYDIYMYVGSCRGSVLLW